MGKLGGFELLAAEASDYAHRKVMMLRDMAFGDSPIERMPLGLVGETWEPGGRDFEKARASTAKAMTRLAKVEVTADQVMDWEVRSWLREKHYGDASMAGLIAAADATERGGRA